MTKTVGDITALIREVDSGGRLTAKELGWEIAASVSNGVEGLEPIDVARFVEHYNFDSDPTAVPLARAIVAEFNLEDQ